MDSLDYIGTRDGEKIVVSLQIMAVILESLAAKISLGQRMALNHCSHCSVE